MSEEATQFLETCAACGAPLEAEEWHPVVTETGEETNLYSFCDEACRDAWTDDRPEQTNESE